MSSDYLVLCVSHDPAILVTDEHHFTTPAAALAAAADPAAHEQLHGHVGCDLLVGRSCGNWVEFACPGNSPGCDGRHTLAWDTWTDAGWLRLLHASITTSIDTDGFRLPQCWSKTRVLRLGRELGMPEAPQ